MENAVYSVFLFTNLPDLTRCSIWILDGDLYHKGLLKFAVTAESLKDSLAVLVVDMSRPWTIMESLQKWTSVLREHVDKLKIAPGEMKEMEQSSKRCFVFLLLGCSRTNILVLTCTGNSDSSVIVGESMYMKSTLLLDLLFDFRVHTISTHVRQMGTWMLIRLTVFFVSFLICFLQWELFLWWVLNFDHM